MPPGGANRRTVAPVFCPTITTTRIDQFTEIEQEDITLDPLQLIDPFEQVAIGDPVEEEDDPPPPATLKQAQHAQRMADEQLACEMSGYGA